jgi:Protein kinase domain/HEAT repeats
MHDDLFEDPHQPNISAQPLEKEAAGNERPKNSPDSSPTISLNTRAQRLLLSNEELRDEPAAKLQSTRPDAVENNPGTLFTHDDDMPAYELKEKIGEGAMGTVYRAESPSSPGSVAVKLLKTSLLGDKAALHRFEKEAHAISQMTHPNIVQIYGVSSQKDDPYIVMEYVEGESLADILQPGRTVSSPRVIEWTLQICSAMKHAHDKGIVHRDLKPSNILLAKTSQGEEIKLVDFGIAKLASGNGKLTELTQKGEVLGSPNYMSPEQCAGKPVDARSDIYALGCIIYEALSGRTLFVADNSIQILVQHISSPVSKQLKNLQLSGVSPSLVSVLSKMLEKEPGKRYQDAESVSREFERLKAGRRSEVAQLQLQKTALLVVALTSTFLIGVAALDAFKHATSSAAGNAQLSTATGSAGLLGGNSFGLFSNDAQSILDKYIKASKDYTAWRMAPGPKNSSERRERQQAIGELRKQTRVELSALGAAAIPVLLANLETNDVQDICGRALSELGPAAVDPAIDWLRHHPSDAGRIGSVLVRIGKPAGDKLALLTRFSESDRSMAAAILANPTQTPRMLRHGRIRIPYSAQFGSDSKFLSSARQDDLIVALSSTTDIDTKRNLVEALQNIQDPSPQTFHAIETVLIKDNDEDTRMAAADTLSQWLSDVSVTVSQPILDALTRALSKDPSSDVRKAAALGLSTYKNPTPELIAEVRKAKADPVNSVRQAVLVALSKFAVHDQNAMPDLIEALKEQDRDTVQNALQAIEQAGSRAITAVPALLALDANPMPGLRTLNALKATESDSPAVVKRMLVSLEASPGERRSFERRAAIQYFLRQTPATASVAVPALKKIADEEKGFDSFEAKRVLKQLNATTEE